MLVTAKETTSGLKKGVCYIVLCIEMIKIDEKHHKVDFRVFDDNFICALYSSNLFTVHDPSPRLNSIFVMRENGNLFFGPEEIADPNFWERFFGNNNSNEKEILSRSFPELIELIW